MMTHLVFLILALDTQAYAYEVQEQDLKCQIIDEKEMYLKCNDELMYVKVQKSFNSRLVKSSLIINDSRIDKKVDRDSSEIQSTTNASIGISK